MTPIQILENGAVVVVAVGLSVAIYALRSRVRAWIERKGLMGLGLVVLGVLLAWQATLEPRKASFRWISAAAVGVTGFLSLLFEHVPWIRERTRVEHIYLATILIGLGIGASALLVPMHLPGVLLGVAGVVVLVPLGVWIWLWYQRRRDAREWSVDHDDAHRPR